MKKGILFIVLGAMVFLALMCWVIFQPSVTVERSLSISEKDALEKVIKAGDARTLARFLKKHPGDVNTKMSLPEQTMISLALEEKTEKVTKLLLDKKADLEIGDKFDKTPLYNAVEAGDLSTTKLLLSCGANVHTRDGDKNTLLFPACNQNNMALVKLLLEKGCDPRARNKEGYTPLHSAASRGNIAIAKLLLNNKADVNARTEKGNTPLGDCIDSADAKSPQDCARSLKMARYLITRGADIDTHQEYQTLLSRVISLSRRDVINLLISKGADVNLTDSEDGMSPLWTAVSAGDVKTIELLISKGADVNYQWKPEEKSLLGMAIQCCGYEDGEEFVPIVKLMLDNGADVNRRNENKQTYLHQAVLMGKIDVVKLLLAKKVNANARDNRGETALDKAVLYTGRHDIIKLLRPEPPMFKAMPPRSLPEAPVNPGFFFI